MYFHDGIFLETKGSFAQSQNETLYFLTHFLAALWLLFSFFQTFCLSNGRIEFFSKWFGVLCCYSRLNCMHLETPIVTLFVCVCLFLRIVFTTFVGICFRTDFIFIDHRNLSRKRERGKKGKSLRCQEKKKTC